MEVTEPTSSEKVTPLEIARSYLKNGMQPISIPFGHKGPISEGWQNLIISENDISNHFGSEKKNIGILLGQPSKGLVDIDFDVREAVKIAPTYLPHTRTFGRTSNPASHRLYYSEEAQTKKFTDTDGTMLVELRSTGCQTVFPGSIHPSGEEIRFENPDQEIIKISKEDLLERTVRIALCTLLARHWPKKGSRQDFALALAGGLLRNGVTADETAKLITLAAKIAGDDEANLRSLVVEYTQKNLESDSQVTGWPSVETFVGEEVVRQIHRWLALIGLSEPEPKQPAVDKETSHAQELIAIGKKAFLFHDDKKDPFVQVEIKGIKKVVPIKGRLFSQYLVREYYIATGRAPGSSAVSSAISVLQGMAFFDGPCIPLHVRFHADKREIWIDMGDDAHRAIKLTKTGWDIVNTPPILFRRFGHEAALPIPDPNGDPRKLLEFLNVKHESDQIIVLVWVISAVLGNIARPLLCLAGPQGSAKTTAARVIRDLIDPTATETLYMPDKAEELAQTLDHYGVPLFDNLTNLSQNQANLLCQGVTGGAFSKRELWTDSDDHILKFRRAILMTGINVPPTTPDLLDRSIIVELERLNPNSRMTEEEVWANFEKTKGFILGGILNTLVRATQIYPDLKVKKLHRLADFTRWGAAISEALGYGQERFLAALFSNADRQLQEVLDDPLAQGVLELARNTKEWEGTPTELFDELNKTYESKRAPQGWPKQPNVLSRKLKELQSHLAEVGISIEREPGRNKGRIIRIRYEETSVSSSQLSQASQPLINQDVSKDGHGNGSSPTNYTETLAKDDKDGQDGIYVPPQVIREGHGNDTSAKLQPTEGQVHRMVNQFNEQMRQGQSGFTTEQRRLANKIVKGE